MFCRCLRKKIEVFTTQPSTTGFYNRGGKCLLRGTTWLFKLNGLRFFLKWLTDTTMYMQYSAANYFTVFIYIKGVTIQPTYTVIIPSKHLKLSSENFPFAGKL